MNRAVRIAAGTCFLFTALAFVVFLSALLFQACSSSVETSPPRRTPVIPSHSTKKIPLPDGWSIVSGGRRSSLPELYLMKDDMAASMVVKELKPVASAKNHLAEEDVCVLGNISMQNKLVNDNIDRRILRPPSVVGNEKRSCVYMYSENALLRRVVVFRARSTIYEVELFQENESLPFSAVIEAQSAFVRSLMNGD